MHSIGCLMPVATPDLNELGKRDFDTNERHIRASSRTGQICAGSPPHIWMRGAMAVPGSVCHALVSQRSTRRRLYGTISPPHWNRHRVRALASLINCAVATQDASTVSFVQPNIRTPAPTWRKRIACCALSSSGQKRTSALPSLAIRGSYIIPLSSWALLVSGIHCSDTNIGQIFRVCCCGNE